MKLVKMSLAAAMLMGASAFAIDNVKVSGNAQLFYMTTDIGDNDLLYKDGAAADAALHLNGTADLAKNDLVTVSAGIGFTALTTLGLENNLVSNVWGGAHVATAGTKQSFGEPLGGVKVENASWFNEAWMAFTVANTTAKLGRMNLDTPLAFTETWSVESNSFEAAVLVNSDIPDTTLVGAYVGNGNGTETFGQDATSNTRQLGHAWGSVVNGDGKFTTYGTDGAYALGIINNSFKPLVIQGWYYDVTRFAEAYWLQADLNLEGILVGAQYSAIELGAKTGADGVDSNVYAVMLGYEMKDMFTAKVAYSAVDTDFAAGFNTATGAESKLYTEAWWNFGYVTAADTETFNVTVEGSVSGFDLGLYYVNADQSDKAGNADLTEIALTATTSVGPVDATLAYVNTDAEDQNDGDAYNNIQAYITFNF